MSFRLAIALACVCASTACLKAPPFQGIGDDGGPGNGDGDATSSLPLEQWGFLKAAVPGPTDKFGTAVAISGDGTTVAAGALNEDGSATVINDPVDEGKSDAGAVNVFTTDGATWSQQAYIKADTSGANDLFGSAVALSADGNTLAVGAPRDDGPNDTTADAGAVYVFVRNGASWTQQAYRFAANAGDGFGTSVALSSDGNTLAVGAPYADSAAGTVYVFRRTGGTWDGGGFLKASNTGAGDNFGISVALSGDASTLAVSAPAEDSDTKGINTTPNEAATGAGAVYVFRYSGSSWPPTAYIKPSNTSTNWDFGRSVALSSDGTVLAVGATGESSSATGVDGLQTTGGDTRAGAVFLFELHLDSWSQPTYIKASNTGVNDQFGASLSLARSGTMLLVGAPGESSKATGIGGDQLDNSEGSAGAAYLFQKTTQWQQTAYVKASTASSNDLFGRAVALADVTTTFAIGADGEDTSGDSSGAVYVFRDPQ